MTKQNISLNASVLLLQEGKTWIAQCLEWDIAAQGDTIDHALNSFERTFVGQIILDIDADKLPLEGISQSPKEYWEKFEKKTLLNQSSIIFLTKKIIYCI
jgi:hypothetical protein